MPLTLAISGSGAVWAVAVNPAAAKVATAARAASAKRRGADKAETDRWVIRISLSVRAAGTAGPAIVADSRPTGRKSQRLRPTIFPTGARMRRALRGLRRARRPPIDKDRTPTYLSANSPVSREAVAPYPCLKSAR